ncbi:concanavalin A-like lectin/glucanase domain-containing protein [Pseudoneurospora amorphoporcata]|uniref:Concanavalin A-like lectin/glucanase domain-containing protein n=1 Tax=Pseudoneurospora amorphoporcata TaxID=241081 RepID=A0AAN6SCK6_9PEZI|nr:concanavalin A-like lectin/glucanase domain-containing protein [Pseudoneurospora amorphoporcata]
MLSVIATALLVSTWGALAAPASEAPKTKPQLSRRSGSIALPPGYSHILFQDDFSVLPPGSQPSPSKWIIATGTSYPNGPANWGTNEVQTYTKSPSNVNITSSGTLLITPLRSVGDDNNSSSWTSARIETVADHIACPPGGKLLMSASLKFGSAPAPSQMGIWPSFWALGSAFRTSGRFDQWPAAGEIDIAESTNGSPAVWQSLHCGTAPGGPCNEFSGLSTSTPLERDGRTFHVFSAEIDRSNPGGDWREEKLTYLVDGKPMVVLTGAEIGDEKAWTAVTRMPKYLILNVAVGGDFPNNVANSMGEKTPNRKTTGGVEAGLEVEWVAAYST